MTDGANVTDRQLLLVVLGLTAVNLYISWRIADGLQQASNQVNAITGPISSIAMGFGLGGQK